MTTETNHHRRPITAPRHGGSAVLLLLLLFSVTADAQPPGGSQAGQPYNSGWHAKFSPTMAIIIVVVISAFFFMGFFSIYIRQCGERDADTSARPGGPTARSRRAAARGLDPAVIGTFPTLVYADVKEHKIGKGALECAVCLSEFEDDELLRLIPKCDHVFHPECVDVWLASHTTCPVCRANLVPDPNDNTPAPAAAAVPVASDGTTAAAAPSVDQVGDEEGRDESDVAARPGVVPQDHVAITIDDPVAEGTDRATTAALPPQPPPTAFDWRARIASKSRQLWRARSMARPARFSRSHSTGHSVVQPGEDCERFTLRLPEQIRRDVLAGKLQRSSSCAAFPTAGEGSTRRGYRGGGGGEGSSCGGGSVGGRSFKIGRKEWAVKSDRWAFFTRTLSMISPRGGDGPEGSTRRSEGSTRGGGEGGGAAAAAGEGSFTGKVFPSVRAPFDCLSGGAGVKADGAVDDVEASPKAVAKP